MKVVKVTHGLPAWWVPHVYDIRIAYEGISDSLSLPPRCINLRRGRNVRHQVRQREGREQNSDCN